MAAAAGRGWFSGFLIFRFSRLTGRAGLRSKSVRKQAGTPARKASSWPMNLLRKTHQRTPDSLGQHDVLAAGTTPAACFNQVVISPYTFLVKHV